jgi:hypothetical protein
MTIEANERQLRALHPASPKPSFPKGERKLRFF